VPTKVTIHDRLLVTAVRLGGQRTKRAIVNDTLEEHIKPWQRPGATAALTGDPLAGRPGRAKNWTRRSVDEAASNEPVQHARDQGLIWHAFLESTGSEISQIGRREPDIDAPVLDRGGPRRLAKRSQFRFRRHPRPQDATLVGLDDAPLERVNLLHLSPPGPDTHAWPSGWGSPSSGSTRRAPRHRGPDRPPGHHEGRSSSRTPRPSFRAFRAFATRRRHSGWCFRGESPTDA